MEFLQDTVYLAVQADSLRRQTELETWVRKVSVLILRTTKGQY